MSDLNEDLKQWWEKWIGPHPTPYHWMDALTDLRQRVVARAEAAEARAAAAEAECAKLRAALEPFAEAEIWTELDVLGWEAVRAPRDSVAAARAALAAAPGTGDER